EHTRAGEKVDENSAVDVSDEVAGRLGDGYRQVPWICAGVRLPLLLPSEQHRRAGSWQVANDVRTGQSDGFVEQGHDGPPISRISNRTAKYRRISSSKRQQKRIEGPADARFFRFRYGYISIPYRPRTSR